MPFGIRPCAGQRATRAATVQLSVPVMASVGGLVFLGEPVTLRILITGTAILGGMTMVIIDKQRV